MIPVTCDLCSLIAKCGARQSEPKYREDIVPEFSLEYPLFQHAFLCAFIAVLAVEGALFEMINQAGFVILYN